MSPTTTRAKKNAAKDKPVPLPRAAFVVDRVRLKTGRAHAYKAVYDFNEDNIRVVTRIDTVSNGDRLWVEGAPHMFWRSDVELIEPNSDERRSRLRRDGHNV